MGCVSSAFLENDDGSVIDGGTGIIRHHIVSLTSTTYGLLTSLDHQTPATLQQQQLPPPPPSSPSIEVINSWELMAGLDPQPPKSRSLECSFPILCPPGGENSVILYTTTLRGIRKTFEDCNLVRSAIQALGVDVKERDISMDLGFREELRELMRGTVGADLAGSLVPRLFVKGRYVGGVESVMRINEEGGLVRLLEGMPKSRFGGACDGCFGIRFVPCFRCSGSRKIVVVGGGGEKKGKVVTRCGECNENGLVLCPICS